MAVADTINQGYKGVVGIFDVRRKYDLSDKMIFEDRVIAKFLNAMSRNLTKIAVSDPEPKLLRFEPEANIFPFVSDVAASATSVTINENYALQLQAGDRIAFVPKTFNGTSQVDIYEVTSTPSGSGNVTVNISPAATSAYAAADYDIIWLGNALEDGGVGGIPIFKEPGVYQTYLQTFHKVIGETRTRMKTDYYGKMSLQKRAILKRQQLMEEIEMAFFLNKMGKTTVNGAEKRYMSGLYENIPASNKIDMTNKMNLLEFSRVCEENIFARGNKRREKFLFAGGGFKYYIDAMFYNSPQMYFSNPDLSRFYGYDIQTLKLSSGKLHVVTMDIFRGTGLYDTAFWVDMDYVTYLYLKDSDLQITKGTEPTNAKWNRKEWVLWGELGLYVAFHDAHGFLHSPS